VKRLKDPIDDFRLMIDAALEACLRRRKLVYKYYEHQEMLYSRGREGYAGRPGEQAMSESMDQ
jgi:hypothetical protein